MPAIPRRPPTLAWPTGRIVRPPRTILYTRIDDHGRGIWINRSTYPYEVAAKLRLKTSNGSSASVRLVLVAAKQSGEVVDLAELLGRSDLEITGTVSGSETDMVLNASAVQLQNSSEIITLRLEADTDLDVVSGDIQMAATPETQTSVSIPDMTRRSDGLSSYVLVQDLWSINNLNADPESERRPNDYLSHLTDVGARLDVDIALDYVASVVLTQEIFQDSTDVDHLFSVRVAIFEHKDGQKNMIATRETFPGQTAAQITASQLGVVGVETFDYGGNTGTSFSVEVYASHKMRLDLSRLLTLPVNTPENLP